MPSSTPEVVIIGAGIGGLCLAQGLRKAGIPVQVYERDTRPGSRWEGYRIAINADGAAALEACLPDRCGRRSWPRPAPVARSPCSTRASTRCSSATRTRTPGSRSTAPPCAGCCSPGSTTSCTSARASTTTGWTASGWSPRSPTAGRRRGISWSAPTAPARPVRKQYLPHAEVVDAGVGGIAVKLPLTDATATWLPERLRTGMNLITDGAGVALFTSVYNPPAGARAALEAATGPQPEVDFAPYVLGALNADPARLPADLARLDADALRALGEDLLAGWHPALRRMLAESEPASRGGLLFSVATETPPWPSSRVTLLGDALHTMPATAGSVATPPCTTPATLVAAELAASAAGRRRSRRTRRSCARTATADRPRGTRRSATTCWAAPGSRARRPGAPAHSRVTGDQGGRAVGAHLVGERHAEVGGRRHLAAPRQPHVVVAVRRSRRAGGSRSGRRPTAAPARPAARAGGGGPAPGTPRGARPRGGRARTSRTGRTGRAAPPPARRARAGPCRRRRRRPSNRAASAAP